MLNGSHSSPRGTRASAAQSDVFFILTKDGLSRAFCHPRGEGVGLLIWISTFTCIISPIVLQHVLFFKPFFFDVRVNWKSSASSYFLPSSLQSAIFVQLLSRSAPSGHSRAINLSASHSNSSFYSHLAGADVNASVFMNDH